MKDKSTKLAIRKGYSGVRHEEPKFSPLDPDFFICSI